MMRIAVHGGGWRAAARAALFCHVLLVGAGVSFPATVADETERSSDHMVDRVDRVDRADRDRRAGRRRIRDSQGERGHVRRRSDVIERSTHVERKEGWRRID